MNRICILILYMLDLPFVVLSVCSAPLRLMNKFDTFIQKDRNPINVYKAGQLFNTAAYRVVDHCSGFN